VGLFESGRDLPAAGGQPQQNRSQVCPAGPLSSPRYGARLTYSLGFKNQSAAGIIISAWCPLQTRAANSDHMGASPARIVRRSPRKVERNCQTSRKGMAVSPRMYSPGGSLVPDHRRPGPRHRRTADAIPPGDLSHRWLGAVTTLGWKAAILGDDGRCLGGWDRHRSCHHHIRARICGSRRASKGS